MNVSDTSLINHIIKEEEDLIAAMISLNKSDTSLMIGIKNVTELINDTED